MDKVCGTGLTCGYGLWHRFDMWSLGIIMLQLAVPTMRYDRGLKQFNSTYTNRQVRSHKHVSVHIRQSPVMPAGG